MGTDSNTIEKQKFVGSLAYLLRETFEGSPEGRMSAYLDHGTGFFTTLGKVSAAQASQDVSEMTIAAQTEHAKFYLDRLCEYLNGRTEPVRWEDSWLIETVSETEWDSLREGVKKSYESALHCIAELDSWNEMQTGMAIGMIAHSAYHLGAIRQLAKIVDGS
jgi:hypothetical protein